MPVRISLPLIMSDSHLEELVTGSHSPAHFRRAREGGIQSYGRDRGGRYLLLILYDSEDYPGGHVVATCREMTEAERHLYKNHIGG